MPGMIVLPLRSTTWAFLGVFTFDDGPISRILSPLMTTVASGIRAPPFPSITVAFFNTVIWGA